MGDVAIEVTQADRDAAAAYMHLARDTRWNVIGILNGGCDSTSVTQAFTRHRIASETALRSRVAVLEGALRRIGDMTDIEADFDGFEARRIALAALTQEQKP